MPEITWGQAIAAAAVVIAYATLIGMWRRDRRAISEKAEGAAKVAGQQETKLNGVVRDVDAIRKVDLPAVVALANENAAAIAGLVQITKAQSENINRSLEATDERRKLLDRALEILIKERG